MDRYGYTCDIWRDMQHMERYARQMKEMRCIRERMVRKRKDPKRLFDFFGPSFCHHLRREIETETCERHDEYG